MAYAVEQGERCDLCGTAPWEWEENKRAYIAVDDWCQGCYQKAIAQETDDKKMPGTNVKLVKMTRQVAIKMSQQANRLRRMNKKHRE